MKNTLYVRGDESREEMVKANEVIPVFRRILGKGEELRCACKKPVKKEIFFFELVHKKNGKKTQIYTGSNCASKILKLAGKEKPPLFSLFISERKETETDRTEPQETTRERSLIEFCPLNQELYNAIGILCEAWDIQFPNSNLLELLLYIIKNPATPTQDWAISKFNGMVGKDGDERTLNEMLESLKQKGKELKRFEFPLMNEIVNKTNYPNNIVGQPKK
ncbi:MAG: hypothetical protein ACJASQ_003041 [Crocinitomicaceae bacterium]|jgi:hypothetical protein